MGNDLLHRLSNADAVAGREGEVRRIMLDELQGSCTRVTTDGLGSVLFCDEGTEDDPVRVMFAAHMDEVGFMVRHISDTGFLYLAALGGVLDISKRMQKVRVTTGMGNKVTGVLNAKTDASGAVSDMYVDLGCETPEEVAALGIEIGDMVTFASEAEDLSEAVVMGKALDDRTGCYVIAEALKRLHAEGHACELWMAATSSEEVGTRGGKTCCELVRPDVFVAVDVASGPELDRGFTNHRKLGQGCMIVHFDKTMVPHEGLLRLAKRLAREHGIAFQSDMFKGGGTDAAQAHLVGGGCPALVIGIPLRYCHGAWSLARREDLTSAIDLVCEMAKALDRTSVETLRAFM